MDTVLLHRVHTDKKRNEATSEVSLQLSIEELCVEVL